jgi:hypothetical protein
MAVERRERRQREPDSSGIRCGPQYPSCRGRRLSVSSHAGLAPWRHLHLQSGPSGRRFAARASLPPGRCLCCQVRHDHSVPALCRLPRSWPGSGWHPSVGLDQAAVPPATIGWSGGRLGRVAGGQTVAEEPGVHIRHQRPVVFGQHPHHPIELGQQCQRLPPGRQAKAARPGSRSRRSSARSGMC